MNKPAQTYREMVVAADQGHRDRILVARAALVDAQWGAAAAYNVAGEFHSATAALNAAMEAADGTLLRWPKACGSENGNSKPLGVLNREHRELPDHDAKTHMADHLKLVIDSDYAKPPRPATLHATEARQTERNRKHTFNDIIVAFIAGVIAAWISD